MSEHLKPCIVAGFGRSGTTWVQDVLATANSLRAVFEPLHPLWIRGADMHAHRYHAADDDDLACYRFLHRYFCEDFHSPWADYRVVWTKLYPRLNDLKSIRGIKRVLRNNFQAKDNILRFRKQRQNKRRIVKFVRANMMLPWLQRNFDARIVFIIRHPAAVVMSQMRTPRAWNPYKNIERYRRDSRLLDVLDRRTNKLIFQSLDDVEACTLSWCVENIVALQHARDRDFPVIYYETLIRRGLPEWKRILSALELEIVPGENLIFRPSQQAWEEKARNAKLVRKYASWMNQIDQLTAVRIQNVLDATGMTVYHTRDVLPIDSKHMWEGKVFQKNDFPHDQT